MRQLADAICEPGPLRKTLLEGLFVSSNPNDALNKLDTALHQVTAASLHEKTLRKLQKEHHLDSSDFPALMQTLRSRKLMSEDQIKLLEAAHIARCEVIEVAAFSKAFWHVSRAADE